MTHIRHNQNGEYPRRRQESSSWLDSLVVLVIFMMGGFVLVWYMGLAQRISNLEDAISALEKNNSQLESLIENQRRRREALKNEKVVRFAKSRKMVMPNPGQVCVITQADRWQAPMPHTQKGESVATFHQSVSRDDSL